MTDRFEEAQQRLDLWHAMQHLWAVAHALLPEDEAAATAWIKRLEEKLLASQAAEGLTNWARCSLGSAVRAGPPCKPNKAIRKTIATSSATRVLESGANPWAVARWNPPAHNIRCGFTVRAGFGRLKTMRL